MMTKSDKAMRGLGRNPLDQAIVNLGEALRAAGLVKECDQGLIPSPLTLVIAEIKNAQRYLQIAKESTNEAQ